MQETVPYSEAIVSKYPEQIVIAIARDAEGKYNPITLGWTMIVSGNPPMMAVAIGLTRYSLGAFRHAREFVIAFPGEHQADETMLFGTKSGRDTDKLAEAGTPTEPAAQIDGVVLSEAVANFECRLISEMVTGDHVVFVGEVVCSHVHPDMPSRLYTVASGHKMAGIARA
jgi:flavin reductase (DIM6/NTAB) family NADH-FMN oxidoreductase RutF